jgi:hypothetical protein
MALRLGLLSLILGGAMGLLVLGGAAVAGRPEKRWFWLGGTAWGTLAAGLMLTDCLFGPGPSLVSKAAFPIYAGGLVLWPVVLVWRRPDWFWRWVAAQAVLLLSLGPALVGAVAAALCTFS